MAKLSEQEEFVNALFYGDGGTGKTTALAAMANVGPIVYINAESGLKRKPLEQLGINTANIDVWPEPGDPVSFQTLEQLHLDLMDRVEAGDVIGVCLDSVTEVYKKLLDAEVARAVIKADLAGKERDPFKIELGDYGTMTEQMRLLIRRFRDLPCHFAMAALSRREQDDDGQVTYQPAITPALQNDLVGWVDLVCVTSVELINGEEEHRGLFRPHGKYRGKDRLGALPKWLVDPTFDRVIGYVDETLEVKTDPVMKAAAKRMEAHKAALEAAAA